MRTTPRGQIRTSLASCLLVTVVSLTPVLAQESGQSQELPDSPSAVIARRTVEARLLGGQTAATSSSSSSSSQPSQASPQPSTQESQLQSQSSPTQKPVGTAAAESPTTLGVAASNPAGAAIAPAKQRRARTLFIKVGAILGAGVAVGAVAALASASPSKPPGSH
jgi:hypothetical protein